LLVCETNRAHRITARTPPPRLPASQRYTSREKGWKRYEKPLPGNRLQIDVKFIEPIGVPPDRPAGKSPVTGQRAKQRRRAKYCTRLPALRSEGRCPVSRLRPARSDSGQGVTMVSCVRCVDRWLVSRRGVPAGRF
jgi:hypothetical protein